jgi:hypothetical protein
MVKHVDSEKLCEVIKDSAAFGLNESVSKKCKSLYILDTYYEHFKVRIDNLVGPKIYIFDLKAIKRAAESIGRPHKIRVVGVNV